jgi:hypothetical protein
LTREQSTLLRLAAEGLPTVRIGAQAAIGNRHEWLASIAILLACVFLLLSLSWGTDKRRSQLLGPTALVAGLAWWNWCAPSPLGLLLALVGGCFWIARSFFRFHGRNSAFRLGTK